MAMPHPTTGYINDFRSHAEKNSTARLKPGDRVIRLSTSLRQVRIRFETPLWEALGKPARVEISKIKDGEWSIKPNNAGLKIIEDQSFVFTQAAPSVLGISPGKRPMIRLDCRVAKKAIFAMAPSEGWIGATAETPAEPGVEDQPQQETLAEQQEPQPATPEPTQESPPLATQAAEDHATHDPEGVGLSVYKNGSAATSRGFYVKIKDELYKAIGSPERILVTGTVHEGLWVQPAIAGTGVKIARGAGWWGCSRSIHATGITEMCQRSTIWVRGTVIDGKIKVAGPSYEWVRGAECWRPDARKLRADAVRHIDPVNYRLSQNPTNGSMPAQDAATEMQTKANGNGHFAGTDANGKGLGMLTMSASSDVSPTERAKVLRGLLRVAGDEFLKLKKDLEDMTGMQFITDQKLNLKLVM